MDIVKKVNIDDWKLKVECSGAGTNKIGCGTQLILNSNDVRVINEHYSDQRLYDYGFTCPVCGRSTIVSDTNLSKAVMQKAIDLTYKSRSTELTKSTSFTSNQPARKIFIRNGYF